MTKFEKMDAKSMFDELGYELIEVINIVNNLESEVN